jgi:hypothetical protein
MKQALSYILIAFLTQLLPESATAQKIAFVDTSNTWLTAGGSDGGCTWGRTFRFSVDTNFYGQTYKKFRSVKLKYGTTTAGCNANIGNGFYIREDLAAGVVFYRQPSLDNQDHILYNYNLSVGDTIQYPDFTAPGATVADSVINRDSILIGGVYHRVFDFQSKEGRGSRVYSVIEGVGCVNSPLYPVIMSHCGDFFENLRCFSQSGLVQDFNMRMNACAMLGNNFYINCDVYPETTGLTASPKSLTGIYPNPAGSEIQVRFSSPINSTARVDVYDIMGRSVYKSGAEDLTQFGVINTSAWTNGLYMLVVRDNSEILHKELVSVSH